MFINNYTYWCCGECVCVGLCVCIVFCDTVREHGIFFDQGLNIHRFHSQLPLSMRQLCTVSRSLSHDAPGIPWVGISRACAHLFCCHVFHAGTHFTNTRPVKFRQPLSLTHSIDAAAANWSVLSMCWGFTAGVIYWIDNLHFSMYISWYGGN